MELTKDPEKLQILKMFVSSHEFARPFAAPPGIPPDRAAALIAAFEATTKDPGFLAETAKHQMEVAPVSGKRLAGMLAELYATPEPILAKARAAIGREIFRLNVADLAADSAQRDPVDKSISFTRALGPAPRASGGEFRSRFSSLLRHSCSQHPRRPERRGVLHRQDHHTLDRLHAGRRLRSLRPAGRAPSRQAHSGQAQHRRAEHAGRRQHAGGAASLFDRTQGRHRARDLRRQMGITPLLNPAAKYDGTQVHLARQRHQRGLALRHLEHIAGEGLGRSPENPVTFAGDGPGADPDVFANLYNNVFGTKIKIIAGYRGTNPMIIAMERGEVDGFCGYSWSTMKSRHQNWLKEKTINLLAQAALQKEPDISERPARARSGKDRGRSAGAQSVPLRPGDGAAVRGAARHSGRPQGRADHRVRADAEGPGIPRRDQEAESRSQSDQRRAIDKMLAELYATPKHVLETGGAGGDQMTAVGHARQQDINSKKRSPMNVRAPAFACASH